jgi:hypothetical protein
MRLIRVVTKPHKLIAAAVAGAVKSQNRPLSQISISAGSETSTISALNFAPESS